jgi:hypothetical protein
MLLHNVMLMLILPGESFEGGEGEEALEKRELELAQVLCLRGIRGLLFFAGKLSNFGARRLAYRILTVRGARIDDDQHVRHNWFDMRRGRTSDST